MKTILALTLLSLSFFAFGETAHYQVKEGKFHKGGNLSVAVLENPESFTVQINYEVFKRSWVPVSSSELKGDTVTVLPTQFQDERGYLELESLGEMVISEARLKFIKRTEFRNLKNAYLIEVIPNNGKSSTRVTYHPEIPSAGWAKVEITFISKVPMLNGYQIIAEIK